MNKKTLVAAALILALVAGCTTFSPISGKQVTFDQLMTEWTGYQKTEQDKQDDDNKLINKANGETQAAKNDVQSSLIGYVLQFMNDPSNSGIGVTIVTASLTVLTGGLHLNNLRLNRKIALPEIPMDDDPKAAPKPPAPNPTPAATPMNMSDLAMMGAFGAVGN
jgi:hypothetical protein